MTKGQPRLWSALEVVTDHACGSLINTVIRMAVFPLLGIAVTVGQHAQMTAAFFVIALVRTFCWRRVFNWIMVWKERRA